MIVPTAVTDISCLQMFRLRVMAITLVLLVQAAAQEEVEFPDDYETEDIGDYNYDEEARPLMLID